MNNEDISWTSEAHRKMEKTRAEKNLTKAKKIEKDQLKTGKKYKKINNKTYKLSNAK